MRQLLIFIEREYIIRVRQKRFLLYTFVLPVVIALGFGGMASFTIWLSSRDVARNIGVVDPSGTLMPYLANREGNDIGFVAVDSIGHPGVDAVIVLPRDIIEARDPHLRLYSAGSPSVAVERGVSRRLDEAITQARLDRMGQGTLPGMLRDVKAQTFIVSERRDGGESDDMSKTAIMVIATEGVMEMLIFLYITMIAAALISDRDNRVYEVLLSSARPFDIILGKLGGIALVAFTQLLCWGVLLVIGFVALRIWILPHWMLADIQALQAGADPASLTGDYDAPTLGMLGFLAYVYTPARIVPMVLSLLLFFLFGFMLFASFTAVVTLKHDSQEEAMHSTNVFSIGSTAGLLCVVYVLFNPEAITGPVFVGASFFPLTSPFVMPVRMVLGCPVWQILLSLMLLAVTSVVAVFISGRYYKGDTLLRRSRPSGMKFRKLF